MNERIMHSAAANALVYHQQPCQARDNSFLLALITVISPLCNFFFVSSLKMTNPVLVFVQTGPILLLVLFLFSYVYSK